jgi:hypothetical protein
MQHHNAGNAARACLPRTAPHPHPTLPPTHASCASLLLIQLCDQLDAHILLEELDICLEKAMQLECEDWTLDLALGMLLIGQRWRPQMPLLFGAAAPGWARRCAV